MTASRVAVAVAVGAAVIAAGCALGAWQLRRAAGKEDLQRQVAAAARAAPLDLDAASLARPDTLVHRRLRLRGTWIADRVVYLDNRPQDGRAGFYVLMTLRLAAPLAGDVVVDRGWLPRDAADRARIAPYRTPVGVVDVTGVALGDEPRLLELAPPGERRLGAIWQNFDFDAYARAGGADPVRIVLRRDPGGADDGLVRAWPEAGAALQSQIDRHHGYAFQWFALAATVAAILLYRIVRFVRHAHSASR